MIINQKLQAPPPGSVYIGRGGKWGNPFVMKEESDRDRVCEQYRTWLWGQIKSGAISLEDLASLHGKVLVCFCYPKRCHGETLEKAAAWAHEKVKNDLL